MPNIICKKCYKFFLGQKKRKYCSKECAHLGSRKKVKKNCVCCGNEYERHFSAIIRGNSKYCSHECRIKYAVMEKSPQWKDGYCRYRQLAYSKYPKVCSHCGSLERIEIHHINNNRRDNRLENLMPLCRSCHIRIDGRSNRLKLLNT